MRIDRLALTTVEALRVAPREIAGLARPAGVHVDTVRSHPRRLEDAGTVVPETVPRVGRGRPARRYRLREPLTLCGDGLLLLVAGLVRLVRAASGDEVGAAAERGGARLGERLGHRLDRPTSAEAIREITLEPFSRPDRCRVEVGFGPPQA